MTLGREGLAKRTDKFHVNIVRGIIAAVPAGRYTSRKARARGLQMKGEEGGPRADSSKGREDFEKSEEESLDVIDSLARAIALSPRR